MSENHTGPGTTEAPTLPTAAKLRQYAKDAGLSVGARGYIAASVIETFLKSPKKIQKQYK